MTLGQRFKRALQAITLPTLFLGLVAYFSWNATQGERGSHAYELRRQQLATLTDERDKVAAEQRDWERRVGELRNQHVDPDMLDERARAMLNLADPNDIVVPYGQAKKLFTPP